MKACLALRALEFPLFASAIMLLAHLLADQVAVRHLEGRLHGFLVLRDLDDNILASGGLTQLTNEWKTRYHRTHPQRWLQP